MNCVFVLFCTFLILSIFSILLNINVGVKQLWLQYYYFLKKLGKIVLFLLLILFIVYLYSEDRGTEVIRLLFFKIIIYYSLLFMYFIPINYFSTKYSKFRKCIEVFLDKFFNFIEKNFLLNFSFIILAIFLPHNSDITIGLMGSYLFFIITSVYEEYRNEIGNNIEYNRKNIILQLLLNISLCNSFILIEKSISMIYSNNFEYLINPFVFAINILITIILIALNYFLSNNEEKKTPLKQKIKIFTSTCISKK